MSDKEAGESAANDELLNKLRDDLDNSTVEKAKLENLVSDMKEELKSHFSHNQVSGTRTEPARFVFKNHAYVLRWLKPVSTLSRDLVVEGLTLQHFIT